VRLNSDGLYIGVIHIIGGYRVEIY